MTDLNQEREAAVARAFYHSMQVSVAELYAYAYISEEERNKVPDEDCGGPHKSYPVRGQKDLDNAARLIGHAPDPAAVKAKLIRIAKRKGLKLPEAWSS